MSFFRHPHEGAGPLSSHSVRPEEGLSEVEAPSRRSGTRSPHPSRRHFGFAQWLLRTNGGGVTAERGNGNSEGGFVFTRRSAEHGFTLVELMVVIVIIGLLAAIVAINVFPSGDKARGVRAKADISTIEAALDIYKLQNGSYPTTQQGLQALVSAPQGGNPATYQAGGYLKSRTVPVDPWSHPYLYASPGQHGEADVWTLGRDAKDGGEGPDADIGSWQ